MLGRTTATDARVALLGRLIDHAPTFPPASLLPAEALALDRRAQASPHAFVLGRLVWPASRLAELDESSRELSVVADATFDPDRRVRAVEVPPGRRPEARADMLPDVVYVELEPGAGPPIVSNREGWGVKIRCGGAAVPSVDELARFVRSCREYGVPFKATAGLHRAVRAEGAHGFLNLLAAAVFGDEEKALADEEPGAFALDADSFRWRDRRASAEELAAARRERLHAIGSCSFFEPVEELEALGMLP